MSLFPTDYLSEVKLRLQKLQIERTFYNSTTGKFTASRIIYTTESTCVHKVFDYIEKNVYQCRECSGMIF